MNFHCRLILGYEFHYRLNLVYRFSLCASSFWNRHTQPSDLFSIRTFVQSFLRSVIFACTGICISNKSVHLLNTLMAIAVVPVHCFFLASTHRFLRWQMHTLLQHQLQFVWHGSPTARGLYAWFLTASLLWRNNAMLCHRFLRNLCIH